MIAADSIVTADGRTARSIQDGEPLDTVLPIPPLRRTTAAAVVLGPPVLHACKRVKAWSEGTESSPPQVVAELVVSNVTWFVVEDETRLQGAGRFPFAHAAGAAAGGRVALLLQGTTIAYFPVTAEDVVGPQEVVGLFSEAGVIAAGADAAARFLVTPPIHG